MATLVRWICLGLVWFFYRRVRLEHGEHVPKTGPVIVVSNHPNGLIDPIIVRLSVRHPVAFLAKSTLFRSWIGRQAMGAFSCIPVYRAKEADTAQNKETFQRCHALLQGKGWLMLFPEGISHDEPALQPLKTGAARIALEAEAQAGFSLGLQILPIGLTYDSKDTFRSAVTATVGAPFGIAHLRDDHERDPRQAATVLTAAIAEHLAEVVLQAEDKEFWQGFRFAARWLGDGQEDDALARKLSHSYRALRQRDPDRAEALANETRGFAQLVATAGVDDPRALDEQRGIGLSALLPVVTLALPALVGVLLAYLPYRITGRVAIKMAGTETDLISTIKAIGGLVFIGATYALEATAAGFAFGAGAAAAVMAIGPLSGWIALRYAEHWQTLRRSGGRTARDEIKRRLALLRTSTRALTDA